MANRETWGHVLRPAHHETTASLSRAISSGEWGLRAFEARMAGSQLFTRQKPMADESSLHQPA